MNMYKRLPLQGLKNIRDLGGYPIPGGTTRYGVFLRSEIPSELSEGDLAFLRDYGLAVSIDLRSAYEAERVPDVFAAVAWMDYRRLAAFERLEMGTPEEKKKPAGEFWGEKYAGMADRYGEWVKRVFEVCAEAEGAVLFHCTTGKDRTGMIAAMLLGACGVAEEDIIADYCVSEVYLSHIYSNMGKYYKDSDAYDPADPFYSTSPENMRHFLRHIRGKYGSMEAYLRCCGVTEDVLSRIRAKLAAKV